VVSLQGGVRTMSILELLQHIVNEPAPRLMPEGRFPRAAEEFVDACLLKEPEVRKTPKELLVSVFSGVQWGAALFNSFVIRCCHGWSIPGHLTLIWRLGHPPFDRDRLQARSICLSVRFIIYVGLFSLSLLVLVGECPLPLVIRSFLFSFFFLVTISFT